MTFLLTGGGGVGTTNRCKHCGWDIDALVAEAVHWSGGGGSITFLVQVGDGHGGGGGSDFVDPTVADRGGGLRRKKAGKWITFLIGRSLQLRAFQYRQMDAGNLSTLCTLPNELLVLRDLERRRRKLGERIRFSNARSLQL